MTNARALLPLPPLPPLTPNATLRWDVVSRALPTQLGDVLEVGCGRGAAAARLARRAQSLVAVEPDRESFEVAEQRIGEFATVRNCMSFELIETEQYDTVCSFEVLEHIEDDAATLREWHGKLRPGGHLVISVPAWQHRLAAADYAVGHLRRYDPEVLHARLAEAGFVDIELQLYGAPAGYLLEAFRNYAAEKALKARGAGTDVAERTANSGRLFQPSSGLSGLATKAMATPMVWLQRLMPGRGPGLVAKARKPE